MRNVHILKSDAARAVPRKASRPAIIFLSMAVVATTIFTSCRRQDAPKSAPVVKAPAKQLVLRNENDVDNFTFYLAGKVMNNSDIWNVGPDEFWTVTVNKTGKRTFFRSIHMHDMSEDGRKNGRACNILLQQFPGRGYVFNRIEPVTCFIGTGLGD